MTWRRTGLDMRIGCGGCPRWQLIESTGEESILKRPPPRAGFSGSFLKRMGHRCACGPM